MFEEFGGTEFSHGILTFAMTTSAVPGTDKGKARGHDDSEFLGPFLQR